MCWPGLHLQGAKSGEEYQANRQVIKDSRHLDLKLHAHFVHYAHKLVQTRRPLEHAPHLQTDQESLRSAGLCAYDPPDSH